MKSAILFLLFATLFVLLSAAVPPGSVAALPKDKNSCSPTPPDALGPFYEPNAPIREKVGEGYVLKGTVRAAVTCVPIARARIELWLAGPDGKYDNEHRAIIFSDKTGAYAFESNFPPSYYNRPPHIHIRVTADGYRPLVTQHYPESGQSQGHFDLVLVPVQ